MTPEWRVAGTYLEACNCDPVCPCRTVGGRRGGRSTHGTCLGVLSWDIGHGAADGLALAGLRVALVSRYSDDEEGSPWEYALFVDERADGDQRRALAGIFTGEWGGDALDHFPWAWKPSRLLGVEAAAIELRHERARGFVRVDDRVEVRVARPHAAVEPVTCVIPGHDRQGAELEVESLRADVLRLGFDLADVCGYASTFEYAGPG